MLISFFAAGKYNKSEMTKLVCYRKVCFWITAVCAILVDMSADWEYVKRDFEYYLEAYLLWAAIFVILAWLIYTIGDFLIRKRLRKFNVDPWMKAAHMCKADKVQLVLITVCSVLELGIWMYPTLLHVINYIRWNDIIWAYVIVNALISSIYILNLKDIPADQAKEFKMIRLATWLFGMVSFVICLLVNFRGTNISYLISKILLPVIGVFLVISYFEKKLAKNQQVS